VEFEYALPAYWDAASSVKFRIRSYLPEKALFKFKWSAKIRSMSFMRDRNFVKDV
jgi:hypothetical protein